MERLPLVLLVASALLAGCASPHQTTGLHWPQYRLRAQQTTVLTPPRGEQFDASALLILPGGDMLTLRNNRDSLLYRIEFRPDRTEARLVPLGDCFTQPQLAQLDSEKPGFDCEGLAQDAQGRFYICEERRRWILRCDPRSGRTERLPIDWTPVKDYFSPIESNASFEGVAIGNGNLYV